MPLSLSSPALALGTEDCSKCRFFLEAACRNHSAALASRSVQTCRRARTASVFNGWINVFSLLVCIFQNGYLPEFMKSPSARRPCAKARCVRAEIKSLSPSLVAVAWFPPGSPTLQSLVGLWRSICLQGCKISRMDPDGGWWHGGV